MDRLQRHAVLDYDGGGVHEGVFSDHDGAQCWEERETKGGVHASVLPDHNGVQAQQELRSDGEYVVQSVVVDRHAFQIAQTRHVEQRRHILHAVRRHVETANCLRTAPIAALSLHELHHSICRLDLLLALLRQHFPFPPRQIVLADQQSRQTQRELRIDLPGGIRSLIDRVVRRVVGPREEGEEALARTERVHRLGAQVVRERAERR